MVVVNDCIDCNVDVCINGDGGNNDGCTSHKFP